MSNPKENEKEKDKNFLGKKHKNKESYEKEVDLYEMNGKTETFKKKEKVKNLEELDLCLSTLKNPFTIIEGSIFYLNNLANRAFFYYSKKLNKIYEKEDNSAIYEDFRQYYKRYEDAKDESIKDLNPFPLPILLLGPYFYFDLPNVNCPQYYRGDDNHLQKLIRFFHERKNNIFHLYARQNSGSTLYLMKQMERRHQSFIYLDLRKLNNIITANKNNMDAFYKEFKKFLFYSLFNVQSVYEDLMPIFQKVEEYYYYILGKISIDISTNNSKTFIENLFSAYIELYKKYIHKILLAETDEIYKMIIFIIDHYNNEIDIDYISKILRENDDTIIFLIKHSFNDKNEITKFYQYIDDDTFTTPDLIQTSKGIEIFKNKTIVGYYEEFYEFDINNFNEETNILHLYKDELIENFGLINPNYFYRFINFMKDKEQEKKDILAFQKFIKIITTEIELDIRKFYNNKLEDQFFFISKYLDINFEKNDFLDKKQIDLVKKNLPINYFILKFKSKNLINIIPSCNLVKKIIEKKSKSFNCIIYQSKHYETIDNNGEKGIILQNAIEEKISNDYTLLFNDSEKTLIFKCEYIIPSAKQVNKTTKDTVLEYYNTIKGLNKNTNGDISSFMTETEKNDMKKLSDIFFKETDKYKNIILIENNAYAKNYDLGIIKFIGNYDYILILFQITVRRDNPKFNGINKRFEIDIMYILAKIEQYFTNYKSKGAYLIYVLDKDESNKDFDIEKINYKSGLKKDFNDKVFLLYFGRKYLRFLTEDGKIIKEINCVNEKIEFITSNIYHYFLDEYIQKIFDKVIKIYKIEIGKLYIDNYDYTDVIGDYLIISKINNKFATAVINIGGKKIHTLQANNETMRQIANDIVFHEIGSYFFEILNPNEVNLISLFPDINIAD